ncbi:urea amidolyase associated protein UAAP1 [Clostridium tyrobutyricum]|jgi:urea carboxylase-associated protein 2|uniref:urea amidolyase associated protein UAAP1 n=1 Tax=Clostridium tyrobutyricum TaxID=1519 RepID=UPI00057E64BC|nr:urea amidolyase associated protein UAAP1 [Clostridium tyrobutyricum]
MNIIWNKTLAPGDRWSGNICKGRLIKFTSLGEGANLSMLMYNFRNLSEHYNAPDTMKAQHSFFLKKGHAIISDCGRALASIVEDDLDGHDTATGYTTRIMTDKKYGFTSYQKDGNDYLKSGQENFINELTKNGMSKRDLMPSINLFSKIDADERGNLIFIKDYCPKEASVTIRTEMDVYIVFSNTPNPLDEKKEYPSVPIKIEILNAPPIDGLDYCVNYSKYTRRAFENTWEYNTLLGI